MTDLVRWSRYAGTGAFERVGFRLALSAGTYHRRIDGKTSTSDLPHFCAFALGDQLLASGLAVSSLDGCPIT
jgi:hypothetical protein